LVHFVVVWYAFPRFGLPQEISGNPDFVLTVLLRTSAAKNILKCRSKHPHWDNLRDCLGIFKDKNVINGGSFKRAFIFTNKEVTKHSNYRSDTDLIQKEHYIYIQQEWHKIVSCHTKRFQYYIRIAEWPRIKTKFLREGTSS
jgi:hypothetical protein